MYGGISTMAVSTASEHHQGRKTCSCVGVISSYRCSGATDAKSCISNWIQGRRTLEDPYIRKPHMKILRTSSKSPRLAAPLRVVCRELPCSNPLINLVRSASDIPPSSASEVSVSYSPEFCTCNKKKGPRGDTHPAKTSDKNLVSFHN